MKASDLDPPGPASGRAGPAGGQRIDLLWPQVHTLTLLAQLGSFTAAAQRLGLSKAAVSQRIAELERDVGQTLVQRSSRSLRLTEAGRTLVAQSVDAFAQIARGVAEARDQAGAPRGLVRVSAPVALGRQRVAPAIAAFCRAEPAVRVELDLSDRLVTLAHEGFDLAIRHAGAPPDNHVAWRLDDSASVIAASSAYLRRHGTPAHPADLARHACLTYLRPGPALWPFERRGAAGEEPERVHVNVQGPLRANNSEVLRDAALDGLGIALLPDFSAADALARGRLRLLLPQWRPVAVFGDAIWALRPWAPHTPKAVQALVAHLREAFRRPPAA
ncbi:LysR family transcriptional regulator [Piscinibacter sakaiensis]|uniref:Transcriptional regulator, LysR family n=1 Tax=Piscinibacter sakaiensis TaxID=1547922 RepID=A0A0K8NZV3_PISS1|nr:LysR family transcriptional regulator [Piscinibacter sakaiensis]GAP35932.1 transcriptional regulator, LysR family [Piscinibacter sakaiensis]